MAEVWSKWYVELEDYFARYGFDDGHESSFGYELIKKAEEIVNKHLAPFGITVEQDDQPTDYNSCRLAFKEEYGFDDYDGSAVFQEDSWEAALEEEEKARVEEGRLKRVNKARISKRAAEIVKAIHAANEEFDREASDDMSKVLNATGEELPLLVGHLENETAKRILEWRLKSL